MTCKMLDYKQR